MDSSTAEADVSTSNEVDPHGKDAVEVAAQISRMGISESPAAVDPTMGSAESSIPESGPSDIDKKIRALKKKVLFAYVLLLQNICAMMQCTSFGISFPAFVFFFFILLVIKMWSNTVISDTVLVWLVLCLSRASTELFDCNCELCGNM